MTDPTCPPSPPPARRARFGAVVGALVLLTTAFHLLTLPGVDTWHGDAYQLLLHAENIVGGRPYAATGYIQNPERYIAPTSYPPGAPLLMAGAIALFGYSALAIQAAMALTLGAAVAAVAFLCRPGLPPRYIYGLVLAVGLQPYLWALGHVPNSDLPFLLAAAVALLLYDQASRSAPPRRAAVLAALSGAAVTAAVATRPLGLVLLPAFLLQDLVQHRRAGRVFYAAAAAALVSFGAYSGLVDTQAGARVAADAGGGAVAGAGGYAALIQRDLLGHLASVPSHMGERLVGYYRALFVFWYVPLAAPWGSIIKHLLTAASLVLVATGALHRLRRAFGVVDAFCLLYALALLPWSFDAPRYLVPLVPFFYFYLAVGLIRLRARAPRVGRRAVQSTAVAVAAVFTLVYAESFATPPAVGGRPHRADLFLREETPPDAVVVTSGDPRSTVFYARRAASIGPRSGDVDEWLAFADRIGATYALVSSRQAEVRRLASETGRLQLVASSGGADLYRVQRPAGLLPQSTP